MKIIRDLVHVIGGWALLHLICQLHLNTLSAKLAVGIAVGFLAGLFFEMFQEDYNRKFDNASSLDYKDVIRTTLGGVLGAYSAHYLHGTYVDIVSVFLIATGVSYIVIRVRSNKVL